MLFRRRPRHRVLPRDIRRADRRIGHTLSALSTPGPVDTALLAVSKAADSTAFWLALTAALALTGSRGRAAAVRGLITLGAASGFANLVAKNAIRARRPRARGIRHRRWTTPTPRSPGFPSGHSATGAALAVGVAVESPARGAAVGVLALIVSYSRLHVGAHFFSDVVAGILVGVAAAVGGRLLLPPRS